MFRYSSITTIGHNRSCFSCKPTKMVVVTLRAGHCKLMKLWQQCNVKVCKKKQGLFFKNKEGIFFLISTPCGWLYPGSSLIPFLTLWGKAKLYLT